MNNKHCNCTNIRNQINKLKSLKYLIELHIFFSKTKNQEVKLIVLQLLSYKREIKGRYSNKILIGHELIRYFKNKINICIKFNVNYFYIYVGYLHYVFWRRIILIHDFVKKISRRSEIIISFLMCVITII